MPYVLTTPPSSEPVSLADARDYMRIENSDEDTVISGLVTAARVFVENYTGRNLVNTQWTLVMPQFIPDDIPNLPNLQNLYSIYLPAAYNNVVFLNYQDLKKYSKSVREVLIAKNPLVSVDSITYYDTNNTLQTWSVGSPAQYYLDTASTIARIVLDPNASFPDTYQRPDAISIKFTAGYGSALPAPLLLAIKQLAAFFYESDQARSASEIRGSSSDELLNHLPAVKAILDQYRTTFLAYPGTMA